MATVHAIVLSEDMKKDKTWNVKFRISHKSQDTYIKTEHYVEKWQLDKKFNIKHQFILDLVHPVLKTYRDAISKMLDVEFITSKEIKARLIDLDKKNHKASNSEDSIDIIAFANEYIDAKIKAGKKSSVTSVTAVVYSLKDYFKADTVDIKEINYNFLIKYEGYLRTERTMSRQYRTDKVREFKQKPIGDAGLHNHMRDLRLIFNEARKRYNDEDTGVIKIQHYPFKKYKVGSAPITGHRNRSIEEIRKIRDVEIVTIQQANQYRTSQNPDDQKRKYIVSGSRGELARDLFMLSFYMLGMNAADIYEMPKVSGDRLNYNRAKTRSRRKDKAFISVKIIPEAKLLIDKYGGELQVRFVNRPGLNAAIDKGLLTLSEATDIPDIDFYDARHSVGTFARNACGFSFEDVATALNQRERTVTDIYVAPDWSVVDKVQKAVVSLL